MSSVQPPSAKPPYFNKEGFDIWKKFELHETDVIASSYPKCGTSWLHQILLCLLRMDDTGNFPLDDVNQLVGGNGQVYPDGIPAKRPAPGQPSHLLFGGWSMEDMSEQSHPRLFTTHSRAGNLPPSIKTKGRLVMISRNPKDALVSRYYFRKKLSEGRYPDLAASLAQGMEGVFEEFFQREAPNDSGVGYGDYFTWHRDMVALKTEIGNRGFVTFYERLQEDFHGEVARLAKFLQVSLTGEKMKALETHVSFQAMTDRGVTTMRRGVVGDYKEHLTSAHWARMDEIFDQRLGNIAALGPLKRYMQAEHPPGKSKL